MYRTSFRTALSLDATAGAGTCSNLDCFGTCDILYYYSVAEGEGRVGATDYGARESAMLLFLRTVTRWVTHPPTLLFTEYM